MENTQLFPSHEDIVKGKVKARWYHPKTTSLGAQSSSPIVNDTFNKFQCSLNVPTVKTDEFTFYSAIDPKTSNSVECQLCPRQCVIAEGRTGYCSARWNLDGVLYARFYGKPTSVAIDPIEKKPLYHFLPSSSVLSLGTQGCNLSCKFCQNWEISRPAPVNVTLNKVLFPEQVVELAIARQCPSVAFTYNEPSIWAEYVIDTAKHCKRAGIKTVVVTNGMISGKARQEFYEVIDGVNVDLKAFQNDFYQNLTNGNLDSVKQTLEYIAKETQTWLEITNLIVPSYNDSSSELKRMCNWIVETLGTEVPIHFSAFFPTYKLLNISPTSVESLQKAVEIAVSSGVQYAYGGNVSDEELQSTYCPNCHSELIKRSQHYQTQIMSGLVNTVSFGHSPHDQVNDVCSNTSPSVNVRYCRNCGKKIVGVF